MKSVLNKAPGISVSFSIVPVTDERSWVGWGYRNSEASDVIPGHALNCQGILCSGFQLTTYKARRDWWDQGRGYGTLKKCVHLIS